MIERFREILFRLRSLVRRGELEVELEEELRVHRELLADDAERRGIAPEEARRLAAVRLGNASVIRERSRAWWSLGWVESVVQDIRYALRFLRRSPGFTAVAVLSLALGIGANAAVFSVLDRLLLRPPPYVVDPDRLVSIAVQRKYGPDEVQPYSTYLSFSEIFSIGESATALDSVVAYTSPSLKRLGRGPDALRIKESIVSGDFFKVTGVRPALGRFFIPDDDRADAPDHAAVISYGFWQRQFAGSFDVVGERFNTSGVDWVIVGVAPRGFTGVETDAADVWVPIGAAVASGRLPGDWKTGTYGGNAFARLRKGATVAQAGAEATLIVNRVTWPRGYAPGKRVVRVGSIIPARGPAEQSPAVQVSMRLAIAALLVLIAACANVANLLLVRALSRKREIALRLAVGISRGRLVSQLMLEALLLALAGTLAALLGARWAGGALRHLVFPTTTWSGGPIDARLVAFAALAAAVVAMLAGVVPAIRFTRSDVALALRSAAPQLTQSTGRVRQSLLVLQIALSVVLVVGASVFAQSLQRALDTDVGMDLDRLIVARISLESDTQSVSARTDMLEEGARRIALVPGVERAVVTPMVPFTEASQVALSVPGLDSSALGGARYVFEWQLAPDVVSTLGLRLRSGRWIDDAEWRSGAHVVLIDDALARKLWHGASAIGRCIRLGADTSPCLDIVGTVGNLYDRSIRHDPVAAAIVPPSGRGLGSFFKGEILVRTTGSADRLVSPVRDALRGLNPDLATLDVKPLAAALDYEYRPLRLGTTMFGSFALLALLLAGVGIYGLLAFGVAQRAAEFGICSALGARSGQLIGLVAREAIVDCAIGLVIGVTLSWFAARSVEKLLFDTSVHSAAPYLISIAVLGTVATLASIVPARRVACVDPVKALRAE